MTEKTLRTQGFYMPAEWERHEGTWLQWPHDRLHPGNQLKLERTWLMMVDVLHEHENVHIIIEDERQRDHVVYQLQYFNIGLQNVDFYIIPTDDLWARDNGPIFVLDDEDQLTITNWKFNGWGERYEYQLDDQVPSILGESISVPVLCPSLVLEGGAVEVNGNGTFMATRTSIINSNRNPRKSQEEIEEIIKKHLGVRHFIWLTGADGPECAKWGDDTDSHIDIVARFTGESTVLYNWTDDRSDPRYAMIAKHHEELQEATTETGKSLTLIPLPLPRNGVYRISPSYAGQTSKLTDAAYSNYFVANGVVLLPVFGNANDERAKKIIAEQFPDREIVAIDAVNLNEGGGAIHCVTQQQPMSKR